MLRGSGASPYQSTNVKPSAGQTIIVPPGSADRIIYINPTALLASLTITLPSDSTTAIGQVIRIATSKPITLLTINGASTLLGLPTGLILGDNIGIQKLDANTWHRMT